MRSKNDLVVSDIGVISPFGIDFSETAEPMNELTGNYNYITGFDFYAYNHKVKSYIDRCSQLCIHSISQLFSGQTGEKNEQIGIFTASKYACLDSSAQYLHQLRTLAKPQFASPIKFTHSMCNIPNSLSSIEFGITGASNHNIGDSDATMAALWQACYSIEQNEVKEAVVCGFDTLSDEHIRVINIEGNNSGVKYSEAAGAVKICARSNLTQSDIYFEILGFGFANNKNNLSAANEAIMASIDDAGMQNKDISLFISNFISNADDEADIGHNLYSNGKYIPHVTLKRYIGECFAAYPLLALAIVCKNDMPAENGYRIAVNPGDTIVLLGCNPYGNAVAACIKRGGKYA